MNKNELNEPFLETRLSGEAKTRIKTELLSYMKAHPLRAHTAASQYAFFFPLTSFIRTTSFKTSAAFLITIFVLGGGTAFAAEQALPGNPLYAVKVNVIEPTRGALAVSTESKARFEVELVKRRLAEAEEIKHSGDTEIQTKVAERAVLAAERAGEKLTTLTKENPRAAAHVALEFRAVLKDRVQIEEADVETSDGAHAKVALVAPAAALKESGPRDDSYKKYAKRLEAIEEEVNDHLESRGERTFARVEQRATRPASIALTRRGSGASGASLMDTAHEVPTPPLTIEGDENSDVMTVKAQPFQVRFASSSATTSRIRFEEREYDSRKDNKGGKVEGIEMISSPHLPKEDDE